MENPEVKKRKRWWMEVTKSRQRRGDQGGGGGGGSIIGQLLFHSRNFLYCHLGSYSHFHWSPSPFTVSS
ncbi:hypothetical protein E2C01_029817 [Portunus trituberculatus]|uniref:Uncharacterized protein n=1 Tax=Portunus trituberculatus TaxID=210409 RepID=A0A5B7ENW4_PORTR|nr:hypothetical protein [Portunus trituberculatus]